MRRPARRADQKGRSKGTDRHLQLQHFLLTSAAWRSLVPVERALFVAVAQRYNGFNNGNIGLGVHDAAAEIHAAANTVTRAFNVLIERGFLERTKDSSFRQKKIVREWRVTCFSVGAWDAPSARATHDYQRWQPPENQKPVSNDCTPSLNPEAPVSNDCTIDPPLVSNDSTIDVSASRKRRHPYISHGGGAGEARGAEPGEAQRSAADEALAAQLKRVARYKRVSP